MFPRSNALPRIFSGGAQPFSEYRRYQVASTSQYRAIERCFGLPGCGAPTGSVKSWLDDQPSSADHDDQDCKNDRADDFDGLPLGHPPIVGNYPSFLAHRPAMAVKATGWVIHELSAASGTTTASQLHGGSWRVDSPTTYQRRLHAYTPSRRHTSSINS
jgi:hypothetical protein